MSPHLPFLLIDEVLLDTLLSALRRHHREDSERLLLRWAETPVDRWVGDDESGWDAYTRACMFDASRDLTMWVQREVHLHLDADRAEHALALIERYRPEIGEDDKPYRSINNGFLT